jgi:hypothetical protein
MPWPAAGAPQAPPLLPLSLLSVPLLLMLPVPLLREVEVMLLLLLLVSHLM